MGTAFAPAAMAGKSALRRVAERSRGWSLYGLARHRPVRRASRRCTWRCPPTARCTSRTYWVTLVGKIMCYAIVALAMDLIWGYAGILSLGHGLFFALGGYAMGMYLMRSIGHDGVYQSDLPDFMVFLDWKNYPWYWSFTDHFWYAALLVVLVPGLLAFVFGFFAFRSRIKGVYFSIITQALTYAFDAAVLPQRHRLRRQQRLHRLQAHPGLSDHGTRRRAWRCS